MTQVGIATRMTVFVAVFLAFLMLGIPSAVVRDGPSGAVGSAAAAADIDRMFIIGQSGLSVATLNPFTYTMVDEYMAIWPCMSTLLTYDMSKNRIGDLAKSWSMSPDGLTWTFDLVDNAYFVDPSNPTSTAHPVTADDVIYTYGVIQNYSSNLHFYFPGGPPDGGPPTIQTMSKLGTYRLSITLRTAYAPFLGALTSIPVLPKYYWQPFESSPSFPKMTGMLPIGSGPWYYALPGLPSTGEIVLKRNPIWFQETNRGWQLHVDTLKIKDLTDSATAWLELKLGNIDVMMGVPPSVFVDDLPGTTNVVGYSQSTGFVYEYNLNQMSDTLRAQLVAKGMNNFRNGENNQILLDPTVKKAIAMTVNKPAFIAEVLQGLGTVADSLIPDVNPWYYHYGSAPGETPIPFDPVGARTLLWNNGWKYDAAGREVAIDSTQVPLYGYVGGVLEPLQFRFFTLSDSAEWAVGASLLKGWAAQGGVDLLLDIKSVNQMNSIWWAADYDLWLWDWMFTPLSDPSTDVMSVMTTMEIGSWSDIYYSNTTFDSLYNRSLTAMDPTVRRQLTDEMQRMAYKDMGCQLVAYRKELYAVSTKEWTGYGDWNTNFFLMPDQGYPYLYMQVSPNGPSSSPANLAPVVTSLAASFQGTKGSAISFTGAATDTSTLNYQWYWGDGTKSGWLASSSTTHTYAQDGYYQVYFAAKETTSTDDFYISWKKSTVKVVDLSNTAPHDVSIGYTPATPDTGDVMTFTGNAIDDNGDTLYYSWNFGDTYTGNGRIVTHQYVTPGSYTVTLSVTDNHVGTQPRPVNASRLISVADNRPPTISVPSYTGIQWKVPYTFTVTASDPDAGDSLRYTWYWGDGSFSVTTTNTASHTYMQKLTFTLRVHADDLTGLPGHNVSGSNSVQVVGPNKDPTIVTWSVSKNNPYSGEEVVFTAAGKDLDGDMLRFTLRFGDGTSEVREASPPAGVLATFTVPHTYAAGGSYTAYLYLYDFTANKTSAPLAMTVVSNSAPMVSALSDVSGTVGVSMSFTADAFDPDMDTLKYTWDFGDESPLAVGNPVSHTYAAAGMYVYTVYVDDAHSHNESSSAIATIVPAVSFGLLRVTTNPAVPTMISIDGVWASPWGLNWVKLDPGTYTLSFSDVPGFVTPAPVDVTISAGATTNYVASFVPCGSLRVVTSPAVPSTVYVNGIPRNDWGFWVDVPAGTYTVSFGAVANYATPAPQTVTVTSGGYTEVTGVFVSSPGAPGPDPATYGMLRLTTNPAVPSMVYVDGSWMSPWGLNWVKLSVGVHTLEFSDVPGFVTPAGTTFEIRAGQTTTLDVAFQRCGSLRVITSPAVPSTIYVDGIPRNDWGMWADVPPGTYVVSFGAVPGYRTPAPQTVTVTSGGYTEVTGTFVPG